MTISIDEPQPPADHERGPVPQWHRQIEVVARLPKSQQQFVSRMLETVAAEAAAQ
jgi:hypothetical protein